VAQQVTHDPTTKMGRRASGRWQLPPVRQASGHKAPLRDLRGEAPRTLRRVDEGTQGEKSMK